MVQLCDSKILLNTDSCLTKKKINVNEQIADLYNQND